MIKDKIFKGNWRLPSSSETLDGTLSFDPINGPKLEIFGRLQRQQGNKNFPVILGSTTNGFITLLDTEYHAGESSNETGSAISNYSPSFILVGYHFEKKTEMSFDSVSFSLFNLLEWLGKDGFHEDKIRIKKLFNYEKPNDIKFSCYEGCSGKIEFDLGGKFLNEYYKVELEQKCQITLSYMKEKSLEEILSDIFVFVRFITLCVYEQSYPTEIILFNNEVFDAFVETHLKKKILKPIYCIYNNSYYKPDHKIRKWPQHLLRYESIASQLDIIIPKWFEKSKELEPVIHLLLNSFVNKYEFTTEKFMDIARAIEAFHRRNHAKEILPKKEFDALIERICSTNLSLKERKWAKEKLQYANEPSLKERLEEMIKIYSFKYFNERVPDAIIFCRQVRDSRNYYTHYGSHLKGKALDGKQLFDLTENLKLLLFSALFKSIGISSDGFDKEIRRQVY